MKVEEEVSKHGAYITSTEIIMLLEHLSGLQSAELCTERTLMCVAYLLCDDRRSVPLSHRDPHN